jgi:hypothetical protein
MRRYFLIAAILTSYPLSSAGAASAETVEVNGLPCNELCQKWMGIRPAALESSLPSPPALDSHFVPEAHHLRAATHSERSKHSPDNRIAKKSRQASRTQATFDTHLGNRAVTLSREEDRSLIAQPTSQPSSVPVSSTDLVGEMAAPPPSTLQQYSGAHMPAPSAVDEQKEATLDRFVTSAVPAQKSVLILLAKPEVKDLGALGDIPVLLAGPLGVSDAKIIAALSVGHVRPVTLVHGSKEDIDRLIGGEVKVVAAALVSQAEANDFPSLSTLKVFRVPLLSR